LRWPAKALCFANADATLRLGDRVAVALPVYDTTNNGVTSPAADPLPDDVETLKAMLLAERTAYRAGLHEQALRIEKLKHTIAKLQNERFGQSSERRTLLGQLEL